MSKSQEQQIRERREQMPDIYKANYDKAMGGKSKAAAIKAFCLECVCWQREEVRMCTAKACPLYPYRPYKFKSKQGCERADFVTESKNF